MANFLAELKRRHNFRVAAAYAVVAWVLLQLAANVSPILDLPPWIGRTVLLLLVLGFPVALLFAWIHQLAPADGAPAPATIGRLDWALTGALVVVILLVSYQQLAPAGDRTAQVQQQAGVVAARQASLAPSGAISIAVLPFTNLSSDPEQEFFSDGMTEEITAALAKVAELRVVGRTSAFQFKGERKDLRAIGQALSATHLLEGSVRKEGDRLRITAQLVQADNGVNVWTESYDRQLAGVFAIQEDIATAISDALRMPLGLAQRERLVSNRAVDADSYQQYLRARTLVRLRARGVPAAIEILEPLVARNPDYAPAWALLASAYGLTPNFHRNGSLAEMRRIVDALLPKAEAAGRRAIQLDPNLADGYHALARVEAVRGKSLLADDLRRKALALDPNHPDALSSHSNFLATLGRVKEALALKQQLRALEPFVPGYNLDVAEVLWLGGQTDAAIAMIKELPAVGAKIDLATIYASQGRYNEAADVVAEITGVPGQPLPETVAEAARLLRTAPAAATSPQTLPRLGQLAFVYIHIGAPGRILEPYEEWGEAGFFSDIGIAFLWHPSYAPVRKLERFKAYARKAGFVEYWRAKGWPEQCHPTTGDDFACS